MNITFNRLREIKHKLPTGGVSIIAKKLNIEDQTVRNYFGAKKYESGAIVGKHIQPGPDGGIVSLEDTTILEIALNLIEEHEKRFVQISVAEEDSIEYSIHTFPKEDLKNLIKSVLKEDKSLLKEVITEILIENKVLDQDDNNDRQSKINRLIQSHFDTYDDVFKKLAK